MGSEPNPPVYLLPLPLEPRVVQRPLLVTCLAPLLLGLGAWAALPRSESKTFCSLFYKPPLSA